MIYFLQDAGNLNIKIGYAADAASRASALQTGNSSALTLLASMPGDIAREKALHRLFADHRVAGEWFKPVPELLRIIGPLMAAPFAVPKKSTDHPRRIYLAGKVSCVDPWRDRIVKGGASVDNMNHDGWPVAWNAIFDKYDYCGPYIAEHPEHMAKHGIPVGSDSEGRHALWGPDKIQSRTGHGVGNKDYGLPGYIIRNCLDAVRRCDLLFAWIDSHDCYGTIVEIGYALAAGKQVVVAGPRRFADMWFAYEAADHRYVGDVWQRRPPHEILAGHLSETFRNTPLAERRVSR